MIFYYRTGIIKYVIVKGHALQGQIVSRDQAALVTWLLDPKMAVKEADIILRIYHAIFQLKINIIINFYYIDLCKSGMLYLQVVRIPFNALNIKKNI